MKNTFATMYEISVLGLGIVVKTLARIAFILFGVLIIIAMSIWAISESHNKLLEKHSFDPSKNGFSWSDLD